MNNNQNLTIDEYFQIRLGKLDELRKQGVTVYPDRFPGTKPLSEVMVLPEDAKNVRTAGRLTSVRKMGKLIFAHIQDVTGKIQIAFQRDSIGKEVFQLFKNCVDIGDFIGVDGEMFVTRTGELTVNVSKYTFLGKSLHPLPEKWHGLTDTEMIYRQRYLDLIMSEHARKKFLAKSKMIQVIRNLLLENDFIEVETPVLQTKASGALAKPFLTHHQALDQDVFMRIAPETYLKRLVVGGYNRVFEFARCFRNEGISPEHLQDFTMLEYYVAYWNYEDNMVFTETLIHTVLDEIYGSQQVTVGDDTIDFSGSWPRVTFRDLVEKDTGIKLEDYPDAESLRNEIFNRKIDLEMSREDMAKLGRGNLIDILYKKMSRPKIIQPVFLTGHPRDLSPLARASDADPEITDRFQLVAGGTELVNAYSELADPVDQKNRFDVQAALKAAGDEEALAYDDDFVMALEYGLPPTSGWGLGIDRFLKFLFDEDNIKNCVLFPLMKPNN